MSSQNSGSRRRSLRRLMTSTGLLCVGLLIASQGAAQGGMMNASPEERATQRIGVLTERLQLTPEQAEQLEPVLVKQFTEQVALFQKLQGSGDRQAMMSDMQALRTRYDEQIQAVLTDTQKTAYRTLLEEERARRMNRMRGAGAGGAGQ